MVLTFENHYEGEFGLLAVIEKTYTQFFYVLLLINFTFPS